MTADWISLPTGLIIDRSAPYLALDTSRDLLRQSLEASGARVVTLPIAEARSIIEFFLEFRQVVRLPDWCANGWDPLYDGFEEVRADNQFPLAVLVDGLPELMQSHCHLGLQVVTRLEELASALSMVGDQLLIVYLGAAWS